MSKKTALKTAALTGAVLVALPLHAVAEVSGNIGVASMYLWRGLDLSASNAMVSGGLDYAHDSGAYAGVWTASSGAGLATDTTTGEVFASTEYDLYAGYATDLGPVAVDISYIDYNYPDSSDLDFEEVGLALGMGDFNLAGYFGVGEYGHGDSASDNKDNYYSLDYTYDAVTALVGYYDWDNSDDNYTHVDVTYAMEGDFPGAFAFTASKIVDEKTDGTYEAIDDLKLVVSWALEF